jgi:hypothetical protein
MLYDTVYIKRSDKTLNKRDKSHCHFRNGYSTTVKCSDKTLLSPSETALIYIDFYRIWGWSQFITSRSLCLFFVLPFLIHKLAILNIFIFRLWDPMEIIKRFKSTYVLQGLYLQHFRSDKSKYFIIFVSWDNNAAIIKIKY